jgi:hypothetical protein
MTELAVTGCGQSRFERFDTLRQLRHLVAQRRYLALWAARNRLAPRHAPKVILGEAKASRDVRQHCTSPFLRDACLDLAQRRRRHPREGRELLLSDRALGHPVIDDLRDLCPVIHEGTPSSPSGGYLHTDPTPLCSAIDSAISSAYCGATSSSIERLVTHMSDTAIQLGRIYAAVDYMSGLEGQDPVLLIEMSQAMLNDVIEGRGLEPMVEYVKRYCDVLDSSADAERIAGDI